MPVFAYIAKDSADLTINGTIAGDSPRQARELLRNQGLRIVKIEESRSSMRGRGFRLPFFGRKPKDHVGNFTGELSTLLAVGVPLIEALTTLSSQYSDRFKPVIEHLKDKVASGKSLADAMASQDHVFDRLSVKMVEVGENTGNLESVLRQLSGFKLQSSQFKDRVLTALLYPLIILAVSIAVTIFIMSVIVPMLLENLLAAGKPLPWPTRVLKFVSDTLLNHGWWISIVAVTGIVCSYLFLQTDRGSRFRYRAIMKIPILGPMSRKQEISRVSLIIATLMKSGVEFIEAVRIASGTSDNPLLQDALTECVESVSSGREIGASLDGSFFPPMVVQVYTIGQQSGQLDSMLLRLAEDFDRQVESVAARLSTTIEPVLILILSVFVGFILFATLLPILEAGNVL